MTSLEHRLSEALAAGGAAVDASPDLFARVRGSVADDLARRRRQWHLAGAGASVVAAIGAAVWAMSDTRDGSWIMNWWALELISTVVLVGVALWLGPFIKRFGRAYAADVFRANPRTGKSYIVLTDIVYYLIFGAYILFTTRFVPERSWDGLVTPEQIQLTVYRLAGILLIIGILHGLNIVLMPVLGRLFSLNRRLDATNELDGLDE
jgi:hypothetical protein